MSQEGMGSADGAEPLGVVLVASAGPLWTRDELGRYGAVRVILDTTREGWGDLPLWLHDATPGAHRFGLVNLDGFASDNPLCAVYGRASLDDMTTRSGTTMTYQERKANGRAIRSITVEDPIDEAAEAAAKILQIRKSGAYAEGIRRLAADLGIVIREDKPAAPQGSKEKVRRTLTLYMQRSLPRP